jgi:elongation factor P--beta-lysine ligase
VRVADDDTWSDIFSKVLVEHVEPHLGQGRLTVLFEYPAPEAALARSNRPIRASPNASRSMPAASSSPTALAN